MRVRFWMSDKPRERQLSDAFLSGVKLHGDEIDARPLGTEFTPDCDVACMVGVKSRELYRQHVRAGIATVYLDKGYDRHDRGDGSRTWEYWRCAVNGHQPTAKFRNDYPADRRETFGWKFKPWRESGTKIVIAGSSGKYHAFYDLKDPTDYWSKVVKQLDDITKREIVYRPKPSWKEAVPLKGTTWSGREQGIDDVLRGAHCLLTHGSNACFEAMLAGVPSVVLGDAVMKPISTQELAEIEKPRLASDQDRLAVLNFLAYQQWTMLEMLDGHAWKIIRRQVFE